MGKIIYVNGTLVIDTPYFKYKEASSINETPPEGAEIWEPNRVGSIFIINDDEPQSIFNEYYAKGDVTANYEGVELLYKTYKDVHKDYQERISDIESVIKVKIETDTQQEILFKLLYLSIVTSLETFISDIILTAITESEERFEKYYDQFIFNKNKRDKLDNLLREGRIGKREQEIIEHAQKLSYSKIDNINNSFCSIFSLDIKVETSKIATHIRNRDLIAHKNGRTKDAKYMKFDEADLQNLIADTNHFVNQIMGAIYSTDKSL